MILKGIRIYILFAVFVFLIILRLFFFGSSKVNALSSASEQKQVQIAQRYFQDNNRTTILVGVYLLRILNFDNSKGTYQVEFYLNITCKTTPCDPSVSIANATSKPEIVDITYEDEARLGKHYYFVRANMQSNIDMSPFPFDVQKLRIEIEDTNRDDSILVLVPDESSSGVDPQVKIPNWSAVPIINTIEETHYIYVWDLRYSRVVFEVQVYNPIWDSLLRTILPVLVLTLGGILSFFTKTDRIADRLGIITSSLVASVMFSRNFPNGATYMSSYMLVNYVILVLGLSVTGRLMTLANAKKDEQAKKLQKVTDKWIPVIWLVAQILFITYGAWKFNMNFQ